MLPVTWLYVRRPTQQAVLLRDIIKDSEQRLDTYQVLNIPEST